MAKVLRINVDMLTDEAKARLAALDIQFDKTTKSAGELGKAVTTTEAANRKAAVSADVHAGSMDLLTKRVLQYVSVAAVISAIKNTAAWGDEIETMAKRLNATTTEVQSLSFAAKTNGTTLDAVTAAVWQLNQRLASGDESAIKALGKLGLSFDDINEDAPIESFLKLSAAIAKNEDPMRVSSELFGRQAREIFPLLTSNVAETMRQFEAMGGIIDPLLVKKAADLNRNIDGLTTTFKTWVAVGLEPVIDRLNHLKNMDLGAIARDLGAVLTSTLTLGIVDQADWDTLDGNFFKNNLPKDPGSPKGFPKGAGPTTPFFDEAIEMKRLADELRNLEKAERDVAEATKENVLLGKAWHDLYFDIAHEGAAQIKTLTETVQTEMARQREAVQASQLEIVSLMNASRATHRIEALGGAGSLDAQLEALAEAHQTTLMRIEQAGRAASSQGGTEWAENARMLSAEAEDAFQSAWAAIIAGSASAGPAASGALQTIGSAAGSAAQQVERLASGVLSMGTGGIEQVLRLAEMNNDPRSASFIGGGLSFGTAQEINRIAARNVGLTIPQFAGGGEGDFGHGTIVELHGRERITPLDGRGGAGGATIIINVSGAERSDEELADVIQQKLAPMFTRVGG